MKLQRNYVMQVQSRPFPGQVNDFHTIKYPITCVFDVQRRASHGLSTGRFMLYNLDPTTRHDIEFDSAIDIGQQANRAFTFQAGYASSGVLPVLFQGNLKKAFSYREGPDVVTEIEVGDGLSAMQLGQVMVSTAFPWDGAVEAVKLIKTLGQHGVKLGAVGNLFKKLTPKRGVTWLGSTWDVLKRLARAQGGYACIDQQKVFMMDPADVLVSPGMTAQIDASTGLIGTPRRSGFTIDAEMIFEPRVQLMQQLRVRSTVTPDINGSFSVMALSHRGVISGAKDGGVVTALSLFGPPFEFSQVPLA